MIGETGSQVPAYLRATAEAPKKTPCWCSDIPDLDHTFATSGEQRVSPPAYSTPQKKRNASIEWDLQ